MFQVYQIQRMVNPFQILDFVSEQIQFCVGIRGNLIASFTIRSLAATVSCEDSFLSTFQVAIYASHPGINLVGQKPLALFHYIVVPTVDSLGGCLCASKASFPHEIDQCRDPFNVVFDTSGIVASKA